MRLPGKTHLGCSHGPLDLHLQAACEVGCGMGSGSPSWDWAVYHYTPLLQPAEALIPQTLHLPGHSCSPEDADKTHSNMSQYV